MSDSVKMTLISAAAVVAVLCSLIWGIAWYNAKFYELGYCEQAEVGAGTRTIVKCAGAAR